ncbi:hypothetical protein HPB47_024690 [Ixodes persulcatus]|uniref:Uncharacterized protein n=1 Tax=Ixodes persulcatus TaxID=34615 RepID=A0AC60Q5P7_IXOPE|nr:hypothetical protein HPB47_024690 [Ixodes persulcatus]
MVASRSAVSDPEWPPWEHHCDTLLRKRSICSYSREIQRIWGSSSVAWRARLFHGSPRRPVSSSRRPLRAQPLPSAGDQLDGAGTVIGGEARAPRLPPICPPAPRQLSPYDAP